MAFQQRFHSPCSQIKEFDFKKKGTCHCSQNFSSSQNFPLIILSETDKAFYIRSLIPGIEAENFKLTFKDHHLIIDVEFLNAPGKYLLQERIVGHFRRYIKLDTCVAHEKIHSQLQNGLLLIELPKEESEEIEISTQEIHNNVEVLKTTKKKNSKESSKE